MGSSYALVLEFMTRILGKRGEKIVICLVLIAFGLKNAEIRARVGTSWDSLRKYRAAIEAKRSQSKLANSESKIMAYFEANPPKTGVQSA